jgi:hypothetical protein
MVRTMTDTRCETCDSKIESSDASCPTCERTAELTVTNTESSGVSALPFLLLLSAGFVLVLKFVPFLNSMPEFEWEDLIPPHWLNPWLFIVGVVVAVWGVSVLVIMQNDQDRWTGHPKTRGKIRNQSWFQVVAGIVLIGIAVTT